VAGLHLVTESHFTNQVGGQLVLCARQLVMGTVCISCCRTTAAVTPRGSHESTLVNCPVTVREDHCQSPQKLHNATLIKKATKDMLAPAKVSRRDALELGRTKTKLSEQEGRLTDRGRL